jgi:glyoxylase-like metal-dependent hydrolase (beta-lactamase superfamily II)
MGRIEKMVKAPEIYPFFDDDTNTVTYLIVDSATKQAAIIDPVLNYDHRSGKASTRSADSLLSKVDEIGAKVKLILETHAHADHLTGAPYLKLKTGAKVGIGEHIRKVQKIFRPIFNAVDVIDDGSAFDLLFNDGQHVALGDLDIEIIHTPGHTPACIVYKIADALFVGDTLFMPDYGTARADFPGGSARELYRSIKRLLALPSETRLFMCHDYKAPGRDYYAWETTVGEERAQNPHIHDGISEDEFVAMREARDAKLSAPTLLLPSIQVNIRAGEFPQPDANGVSYIKIPIILEN